MKYNNQIASGLYFFLFCGIGGKRADVHMIDMKITIDITT